MHPNRFRSALRDLFLGSVKRSRRSSRRPSAPVQALESRCLLTAFLVNTTANVAGDGFLSLQEAITAANTNAIAGGGDAPAGDADGDTITFSDAISDMTILVGGTELAITDDLVINGRTVNINGLVRSGVIDAETQSRVFNINTSETVTLTSLRLFNGHTEASGGGISVSGGGTLNLIGVSFRDCVAGGDGGGGLFNDASTVSIQGASYFGNAANGAAGSGGGILNGPGGVLTITGGIFSNNRANRVGGGIEENSGLGVTLTNVLLELNMAGVAPATPGLGGGAALHVSGPGDVLIMGGTVERNTAANDGGGLANGSGTMTIIGTEILDNFAGRDGGGVWNDSGTLLIDGVTIENNTAAGTGPTNGGGGIYNSGGMLTITNATSIRLNHAIGTEGSGGGIFNNSGGLLSITNSSMFGNAANRAGGAIEDASGGGFGTTLTDVTLLGNSAGIAPSIAAPGIGGALHVTGASDVSILRGMIRGNDAAAEGGALWNGTGMMTIDGTHITANRAIGAAAAHRGGGIFNNGTLTIRNGAIISGNSAEGASGSGGGIFNNTGGVVSVTSSNITSNLATRTGGGIEDNSGPGLGVTLVDVVLSNRAGSRSSPLMGPGMGGGLHVTGSGDVLIVRGTVNNNSAGEQGGALWNGTGTMTLQGVTLNRNSTADGNGGAIFNDGGTLNLIAVSFDHNIANGTNAGGGAIFNAGGSVSIDGSHIGVNTAALGGGIFNSNSGDVQLTGGFTIHNQAIVDGGGIYNDGGTLTVTDAVIANNQANGAAGSGGGIFNNTGGVVTVTNSDVTVNRANRAGGGIEDNSGAGLGVTLTDVNLGGNNAGVAPATAAPGNGGGLHVTGAGDVMIIRGTVNNNVAAKEGGALWNGTGTMTLQGVTIVNNAAAGAEADDGGGGVFNNGGTLNVESATLSLNVATGILGSGGGIFNNTGGVVNVTNSEITVNAANRAGGGIEDNSGAGLGVTITDTNLGGNNANGAPATGSPGNGGGLHVTGAGEVMIIRGTVNNNTAAKEGGGLWNGAGTMTLQGVTLNNNSALDGGGVFNNGGTLNVFADALTDNRATGSQGNGGGLFNSSGLANVTGSFLSANSGIFGGGISTNAALSVDAASLVINNTASQSGGGIFVDEAGSLTIADRGVVRSNTPDNIAGPGDGGSNNPAALDEVFSGVDNAWP